MNSMTKFHPGQRIVFLGTPEFAVGTLNALVSAGMNVVAVVTAPDRPAGRGLTMRMSAVKLRALELGLPVLQPERLKAPEFLAELAAFDATVQVVVAFRMLPEAVWDRPALGTINLHASLLPHYRRTDQLGHHQWRKRFRRHHLPHPAGHRYRRHAPTGMYGHRSG